MARRPAVLTREAIVEAATALFAERGYAGTGVRDIAAAASTDPALVVRHFGSKELLFLSVMRLDLQDHPLFDAPLEALPRRLVEFVLDLDEPDRGVVVALVGARGEPAVASRLRETHEEAFVAPLLDRLSGPDVELRARLAAVLVGGVDLRDVGHRRRAAAGGGSGGAGGALQRLAAWPAADDLTSPPKSTSLTSPCLGARLAVHTRRGGRRR